jgi:hypothetical protein
LGRVRRLKWVGSDGFDSRVSWVGTGLKRVGFSTSFFQIFLPAYVLDPPVLTGHGSDGFEYGSDRVKLRPRVGRVGSDRDGFF